MVMMMVVMTEAALKWISRGGHEDILRLDRLTGIRSVAALWLRSLT